VPNGAGATAEFFGALTADHTVYSDIGISAGTLNFNNAHMYVIGGAGSLTMSVNTGSASILVQQGTQKINLPLTLASNTNMTVAAGATLLISNPVTINAGKTLTKTGNVLIQAPLTIQTGASLVLASGPTSLFMAPSLSGTAQVDVKTNSLTIDYRGQSSPAGTIRSQLTSGFAGGSWNGNGINTSSSTPNTGLGWNDHPETQSILINYTYYGDTDLNHNVDLTDFTFLAANFNGTGKDWAQGDFNYDGHVDLTDFTYLASNFNKTLAGESLGSPVPEPATAAGALAGIALLGAGRRARRAR